MKQIFKLVVGAVSICAMSLNADMITITPPDADMWDLDHYKAYEWNINLDNYITSGTINSATLYIDNITNNMEPEANDILRGYLLDISVPNNSNPNSVVIYTDNQNPSGFFASANPALGWTATTQIGSFSDKNGARSTDNIAWSIDVALLNQYMNDNGLIGIGLDPDCHYNNSKVRLVLNVPEPSSISMFLFGLTLLSGFAFLRRKRK